MGNWIAAADGSSVRLWDAATGRLVRQLSAGDKGRVYSVAFSPTDNRLLAVGYGGQADVSYVALWDIDAGRELARGCRERPICPTSGWTRIQRRGRCSGVLARWEIPGRRLRLTGTDLYRAIRILPIR